MRNKGPRIIYNPELFSNDFLDCFYKIRRRNEIPVFLKKFSLNNIIIEVGVNKGTGLKRLLESDPKQLYGVDSWVGKRSRRHYYEIKKIWETDSRIKLIRDFSLNAVKNFEDDFFDYVYIDADHHYEAVSQDIEQWYKKVKIGGILAGHDYTKKRWIDVIRAVNEFKEKKNKLYFHFTKDRLSTWLFIKSVKK